MYGPGLDLGERWCIDGLVYTSCTTSHDIKDLKRFDEFGSPHRTNPVWCMLGMTTPATALSNLHSVVATIRPHLNREAGIPTVVQPGCISSCDSASTTKRSRFPVTCGVYVSI